MEFYLKPCPFCAGSDLAVFETSMDSYDYGVVRCNGCGAEMLEGEVSGDTSIKRRNRVIEKWNRRTP